jgi:hypothetical protein
MASIPPSLSLDGNVLSQTPTSIATPTSLAFKTSNPLSSKVTVVLSTSYADSEFREALSLLDERGIQNTAETRRQLRLDLQREVIKSNAGVIHEFGKVAQVRNILNPLISHLHRRGGLGHLMCCRRF